MFINGEELVTTTLYHRDINMSPSLVVCVVLNNNINRRLGQGELNGHISPTTEKSLLLVLLLPFPSLLLFLSSPSPRSSHPPPLHGRRRRRALPEDSDPARRHRESPISLSPPPPVSAMSRLRRERCDS